MQQDELEQMDQELKLLRDENGKLTKQKLFSWLQMRGAITLKDHLGVLTPCVVEKFEGSKILYEVLMDKFNFYSKWRSKGKKLQDLGALGIKYESTQRTNKTDETVRNEIQFNFDKDIAEAFG